MAKLYEIDPEADVLLLVSEPTGPFAPWDPVKPTPVAKTVSGSSPYANLFSDRLLIYSGLTRKPTPTASATTTAASESGLRIKASSKHLSLASKYFKSKLQFADSSAHSDGRVHLPLEGVDPAAVKIVLDAVHGRGRRVPRSVDLETLAKIAVFVDQFQLLDAVEVYAERWIEKLSAPTAYNRDLILWIYVSYVFRQGDLFKEATKVTITQSIEPIRTLGLPIREKIISKFIFKSIAENRTQRLIPRAETIDSERQQVVGQSLAVLTDVVEDLRNGKESHPSGYDTFALGSLFKHPSRLLWPQPVKPFRDISYSTISETVREVHESASRLVTARTVSNLDLGKKRKTPHFPEAPPSPESSPEPVSRRGILETSESVPDVFGAALEKLGGAINGLDLESSLGYYLY